jgi:hypothetical protein
MIVKAIIDRIKSEQNLITRVVALGDADDTNIGRGNEPYIIVGELDNDEAETRVRIRVCYPKGASAYLDDFVLYRLFNMFDKYYMTVRNLAGDVTTHTVTTVDKTVSGTGYTSDGFIFRDRLILVPCLV